MKSKRYEREPTILCRLYMCALSGDGEKILEIAYMNDYWGKDIVQSNGTIKHMTVTLIDEVMKSNNF